MVIQKERHIARWMLYFPFPAFLVRYLRARDSLPRSAAITIQIWTRDREREGGGENAESVDGDDDDEVGTD